MRIVFFYPSLISDWNNGNAHFLRGLIKALQALGHQTEVYEPFRAWSVTNVFRDHGIGALEAFHRVYPHLRSRPYHLQKLDLDRVLEKADLVLAHEWNAPELFHQLGEHRQRKGQYKLLFHDTHHRSYSQPGAIASFRLERFDGVIAFGAMIRDRYMEKGWARRAWVMHEAADTEIFRPIPANSRQGDLVWIGNWGDDERGQELEEFVWAPIRQLGLRAHVYGVRYPQPAVEYLKSAGIQYHGWLANFQVPAVYSQFPVTVHIPRRFYRDTIHGTPTIRVFEALACGIPLICAPWQDREGLFTPGKDYLEAANKDEMCELLQAVLRDRDVAESLAAHGRATVLRRHTCAHRAAELVRIAASLGCRTAAIAPMPEQGSRTQWKGECPHASVPG